MDKSSYGWDVSVVVLIKVGSELLGFGHARFFDLLESDQQLLEDFPAAAVLAALVVASFEVDLDFCPFFIDQSFDLFDSLVDGAGAWTSAFREHPGFVRKVACSSTRKTNIEGFNSFYLTMLKKSGKRARKVSCFFSLL